MIASGGDFLESMARGSAARVAAARAVESEPRLRARALAVPAAPRLSLSAAGFDLIAELKLRSPARGALASGSAELEARVSSYARAGAAMVSVLTEPERFDGSLEHLARASRVLRPLGVPALRKDFVVDRYQLLEARLAGAGGVLLIVRMLTPAQLGALLELAAELELCVLLECFDASDIGVAVRLAGGWPGPRAECLLGVNCRDLRTLAVVPGRLEALAALLPPELPRVAESGLETAADAARIARAGYTLALVGSALMDAADPQALAGALLDAGRQR